MPYFLSPSPLSIGKAAEIADAELQHLIAHRAKTGQMVAIQDPTGNRFLCEISTITKNKAIISPKSALEVPKEPDFKLTLAHAFIAESAADTLIQKATELGVSHIVFFRSNRTQPIKNIDHKLKRWQNVAWSAAKQSERAIPPSLTIFDSFSEALKLPTPWIVLEQKTHTATLPDKLNNATVWVGPEGGFEAQELTLLHTHTPWYSMHLGPRTLRAETAGIAASCLLLRRFGDLR